MRAEKCWSHLCDFEAVPMVDYFRWWGMFAVDVAVGVIGPIHLRNVVPLGRTWDTSRDLCLCAFARSSRNMDLQMPWWH